MGLLRKKPPKTLPKKTRTEPEVPPRVARRLAAARARAERANQREQDLRNKLARGGKLSRAEMRELGLKQGKLDPP